VTIKSKTSNLRKRADMFIYIIYFGGEKIIMANVAIKTIIDLIQLI